MSDHQSASDVNAAFSANGSDPDGSPIVIEDGAEGTTFLAELARAMQTTAAAEQARNAEGTEQRRQAHIDAIRAREALEAEDLRELAKEDVKGIDAWSDGEIKRIKLERERRIAARREQLQVRLEEHRTVVGREVDAVEAAVASYRADIELYFRRLESETDPVTIAKFAGNRPQFPALEQIGAHDAPPSTAYRAAAPMPAVEAEAPEGAEAEPVAAEAEAPEVEPVAAEPVAAEAPMIEAASTEAYAAPEPVADVDEVPAVAAADDAATEAPTEDAEAAVAATVADTEPETKTKSKADRETATKTQDPLIGVMDTDAGSGSPERPWETGSDAVAAVATEATEATTPVNEGSEVREPADESQEPVAAMAESKVVMPRTTGAGSWLRWPNSTVDRSDQGR